MTVKLHPKMAICPGCPGKKLPTLTPSTLIIKEEEKPDTKVATVYHKANKAKTFSLF